MESDRVGQSRAHCTGQWTRTQRIGPAYPGNASTRGSGLVRGAMQEEIVAWSVEVSTIVYKQLL